MDKIGPKEAAAMVRDEFHNEHIDPLFHHQVRFAGDVLTVARVGADAGAETVTASGGGLSAVLPVAVEAATADALSIDESGAVHA